MSAAAEWEPSDDEAGVERIGQRHPRNHYVAEKRRARVKSTRWHRRQHERAELRKLADASANVLKTHRAKLTLEVTP